LCIYRTFEDCRKGYRKRERGRLFRMAGIVSMFAGRQVCSDVFIRIAGKEPDVSHAACPGKFSGMRRAEPNRTAGWKSALWVCQGTHRRNCKAP
ncbi:MAG: hypothetical protein OSJ44_16325, partial [Lachnospiraceae bacterium]|nr:hypothetical protein [Lachnospiraceae bacterium]